MIRFENVDYTYPNSRTALKNIDFHLERGTFTFINGHSGAGKTTLLKLIMAMLIPTNGQVFVQGINLNRLAHNQVPFHRRQIGLVFQDHQLLYDRTIAQNVALPLIIKSYSDHDIDRRVSAALERVKLIHLKDEMPMNISVGEQQRTCIARAVVANPSLLLADEPTGNLDDELSQSIMKLFLDFCASGTTVFIATHDLRLRKLKPDAKIITLKDGSIV